jgi:hypothetical protein
MTRAIVDGGPVFYATTYNFKCDNPLVFVGHKVFAKLVNLVAEMMYPELEKADTEQVKLQISCKRPILHLPYAEFAGLAIKCWLQQTWPFMDEYQMRIEDTLARISYLVEQTTNC